MEGDLFAGIPVNDYPAALAWYERLFGAPPAFFPNEWEAVWEVAEHRYVFIELAPARAGHARHLIFVDEFDEVIARITDRGLEPTNQETYETGVRKATYHDPAGNQFEFGGTSR